MKTNNLLKGKNSHKTEMLMNILKYLEKNKIRALVLTSLAVLLLQIGISIFLTTYISNAAINAIKTPLLTWLIVLDVITICIVDIMLDKLIQKYKNLTKINQKQ